MALRSVALASWLAIAATACGSDPVRSGYGIGDTVPGTTVADEGAAHESDDHDRGFAFGELVSTADASRVIEVSALDDFTFDPSSINVSVGETVTFLVSNKGKVPHDFTLGDSNLQNEHETEMASMSGADMATHDEANAFALEADETKEMTWRFTEAGEIIFGCHTPGHYAAGMRGTITITS